MSKQKSMRLERMLRMERDMRKTDSVKKKRQSFTIGETAACGRAPRTAVDEMKAAEKTGEDEAKAAEKTEEAARPKTPPFAPPVVLGWAEQNRQRAWDGAKGASPRKTAYEIDLEGEDAVEETSEFYPDVNDRIPDDVTSPRSPKKDSWWWERAFECTGGFGCVGPTATCFDANTNVCRSCRDSCGGSGGVCGKYETVPEVWNPHEVKRQYSDYDRAQ